MGMDLMARNPSTPDFDSIHLNWSGWGQLSDILYELGCDLSEMAGYNDGAYIKKATTYSWGVAILAGIEKMVIIEYPDKSFVGCIREEIKVQGSQTPMIMSTYETMEAIFKSHHLGISNGLGEVAKADGRSPATVELVSELDVVPNSYQLSSSKDNLEWITSVALFFKNCGGCYQW